MATVIIVDDLDSVGVSVDPALAQLMVDGANAQASRVAPCLDDPTATSEMLSEAKLVLLGAAQRWAESGAQALTQQQAGPFAVMTDTRVRRGYSLWPTEITQLQDICKAFDGTTGSAWAVDTVTDAGTASGPDWWGYEVGNHAGPAIY